MARLFLAGRFHADAVALANSRADVEVDQVDDPSVQDLVDRLPGLDAIVLRTTPMRAEVIEQANDLKIIARHGVGYDNVDVDAATARGIPLAVVGEANSNAVAEHAFFLMLAAVKDGLRMDACVRADNYAARNGMSATEVRGKTILIVGFGRIGTRMAMRCAAFGMDVVIADPFVPERVVRGHGYDYVKDYRDALERADILSMHRPGNQDRSPELGAAELDLMRDSAILINTARGTLIDEDALYTALTSGGLRAAGLDVTREEPPAPDLPLLQLDNVIHSPHIAGVTQEAFRAMGLQAVKNCFDAIDGRFDPYYLVNPEVLRRNDG